MTTPLLLVHGERDQRCPIEQSEQLFVALRRLGREVVFARFPGESHGFTAGGRPDRRIARLKLIVSWLDAHRAWTIRTAERVLWPEGFAWFAASGAVHRKAQVVLVLDVLGRIRQRSEAPCRASRTGEPFRSEH